MAREVERGDNECGTDTRLQAATDVKMDKKELTIITVFMYPLFCFFFLKDCALIKSKSSISFVLTSPLLSSSEKDSYQFLLLHLLDHPSSDPLTSYGYISQFGRVIVTS